MNFNIKKSNNTTVKYIFMGTFALGSVIIAICSYYGFVLLPIILTALLMGFYYVQVSMILNTKKTISYEQFADSNYYLGFLFTLVSLAITLMSLNVSSDNMNILISQFGVAILTTLLGLFLRIYIINFIPNEDNNRESFDLIISQKLEMIDNQITQNIDKNKMFSDVIDEKINMFQQKTEDNLTTFTDNLIKNLDITKISNIISEISNSMEKNYTEQTKILNSLVSEVKKVNNNYVSSLQNVNDNIEQNYKFINEFKNSLSGIIDKIDQNNTSVVKMNKNYTDTTEELNQSIKKYIETSNANTKLIIEDLSEFIDSHLSSSEKNTTLMVDKLKVQDSNMQNLAKSIDYLGNELSSGVRSLNNTNEFASKQYELLLDFTEKSTKNNNVSDKLNEEMIKELLLLKTTIEEGLNTFKEFIDKNLKNDLVLNSNVEKISLELQKIPNLNNNHEEQ